MFRHTPRSAVTVVLMTGLLALAMHADYAMAQQPQSQHIFYQRMGSRIDTVQAQIKGLQKELSSDASGKDGRGPSAYDSNSGIYQQLKAMDDQCRDLERELRSLGSGSFDSGYDIYRRQQSIEYYVTAMERQVRQMRKWVRQPDDAEGGRAGDREETPMEEEDGVSDEDWAEEWAKGTE